MKLKSAVFDEVYFKGIKIHLKRDDLIYRFFNGNKARKLHFYLSYDFKHIDTIVSYGGVQSNMLPPLVVLARLKRVSVKYYTKKIPSYLKQNPLSNYKMALKFGVEFKEIESSFFDEFVTTLKIGNRQLLIKQGGFSKEAHHGLYVSAKECEYFIRDRKVENAKIFIPSGTGATALFMQNSTNIDVFTTSCVANKDFLKSQFQKYKMYQRIPTILETKNRYQFAKPYEDLYKIYQELKSKTGIEFDMIYDTVGFLTLLEHKSLFKEVIYIHCGGTMGNVSQKDRYRFKLGL